MNGLDELHTCSLGGFRSGLLFLQLFQLTRLPRRGGGGLQPISFFFFFLIILCIFAGEAAKGLLPLGQKIDSRAVGW